MLGNNHHVHWLMLSLACLVSLLVTIELPLASADLPSVLVPLYDTANSTWDPVIQAKQEHPDVPVVAIINNSGGPGDTADPSYAALTQRLHSAGITVIGYTYANYSSRAAPDIKADMDNYKNWYNVDGIFIDQMGSMGGDENYYSNLTSYARSIGLSPVIGNPGTGTLPSYVGTVDAMVIYENPGLPNATYLGGFHLNYTKTNWAILPYSVSSLDGSFLQNASQYVGYIGISNGTVQSAWESLPSYFGDLVATLDPALPPTDLASVISPLQIALSWTAPSNSAMYPITGYKIERSLDGGSTWSTIVSNTGSSSTTYSDTGLLPSTNYTYRVSAINSMQTTAPSNTVTAITPSANTGIVLNNIQTTSGITALNTITLANYDAGVGTNNLLVVGISANANSVTSVKFGGMALTKAVSSFHNNDAEFWYLKNPIGVSDIVVTTTGPTHAVVGAYSFSGVNQTTPILTHVAKHNTTPSSVAISITTKYANDWVLDLPSIFGYATLGSPTCTQQWYAHVPLAITGTSSSMIVSSPGTVTCKWTASSGDFWDDVAIEINAAR